MVEKKRSNSTVIIDFFLTVMAVMKSVIGPGVLSLPYTISKLGYMLAILIFVSVMALSYFSTLLLIKVKNLSKHSNFSTIFYFLHESKLVKGLSSIFIVIKNVGICILFGM
jgi:amino acid permease